MTGVASVHPEFLERQEEWILMRHIVHGSHIVKLERQKYLPMPDAWRDDKENGHRIYESYLLRAQFPEFTELTITGMVGLIHHAATQITMPKALEYLRERCTIDGLPLDVFHRRITREILISGRCGIFTDVSAEGSREPYFTAYRAEHIYNWRKDRTMFVLYEPQYVSAPLDEFLLTFKPGWRVLRLTDGVYTVQQYDAQQQPLELITPQSTGQQALDEIPFVVAGPRDLDVWPDTPPLLGLGRVALAMYRLDADYRHQLYMTGQEMLVGSGLSEENKLGVVGAGVFVKLPMGAELKYVGPEAKGIAAHRTAIQDEKEHAVTLGGQLMSSTTKKGVESAEALELRSATKNASLKTIALAGAAALEKSLKYAAAYLGQDPDSVEVKPDLRFIETVLTGQDATALMGLWLGEAISYETLYENLQRGGLANDERDSEEERALIDKESADLPRPVPPAAPGNQATGTGTGDPNNPGDNAPSPDSRRKRARTKATP